MREEKTVPRERNNLPLTLPGNSSSFVFRCCLCFLGPFREMVKMKGAALSTTPKTLPIEGGPGLSHPSCPGDRLLPNSAAGDRGRDSSGEPNGQQVTKSSRCIHPHPPLLLAGNLRP